MFRRRFIESLTLGAAAAASAHASESRTITFNRTVTFKVKGFSCLTCAVGLDAILNQSRGVVHSRSSYPDSITVIEFNPSVVTKELLKASISQVGFTAVEIPSKKS